MGRQRGHGQRLSFRGRLRHLTAWLLTFTFFLSTLPPPPALAWNGPGPVFPDAPPGSPFSPDFLETVQGGKQRPRGGSSGIRSFNAATATSGTGGIAVADRAFSPNGDGSADTIDLRWRDDYAGQRGDPKADPPVPPTRRAGTRSCGRGSSVWIKRRWTTASRPSSTPTTGGTPTGGTAGPWPGGCRTAGITGTSPPGTRTAARPPRTGGSGSSSTASSPS